MPEPIFMELGMYVMAHELISTAPSYTPSISLCLYVHPLIVAKKWLGKNVTAATNTYVTTEELDE
jgi:hypothetical protein